MSKKWKRIEGYVDIEVNEMGFLDFEDEYDRRHLKRIKSALIRRGLQPDLEGDWEIHGPHQGMNYQVQIGWAFDKENDPTNEEEGTWYMVHGCYLSPGCLLD